MKETEIEYLSTYWLIALRQMQEHGIITPQQKAGIARKVKGWVYDNMKEKD